MLLVAYFTSLFLLCHQTDAAPSFTEEPPKPSFVLEGGNITLRWTYNLNGGFQGATLKLLPSTTVAVRDRSGLTVAPVYLNRALVTISDSETSLTLHEVNRSDEGDYQCEIQNSNLLTALSRVKISVRFASRLFSNVSAVDQLKMREGSNLTLYCGASGNPDPNVTWIRLFENGSESQVLHTEATWNIVNINRSDAGKYRCTANNGVGSPVNHVISVNVSYPPKIINFKEEYRVPLQQSVTLHCQAEGFPIPSFKWSPCEDVCNTGKLIVPEVLNDTVYNCTVTNDEGSDSKNASVVIAGTEINITLTLRNKSCTDGKHNDSLLSKKLPYAVDAVFANESSYLRTTIRDVRCLIVDLALSFSAIVTERHILAVLKEAAKDGNLGDFSVDVSSIKGTRPVIPPTTSPDDDKPTTKRPDDDKTTIIVAVVVSVAVVVAIIVGVVLWRLWKKKQDRKKVNKEVGVKNTGGHKMKQMGGRSSDGYENTGSSSASPEKAAEMTYSVVEQDKGNSTSKTSGGGPKKPPRSFEAETRQQSVDGRNKSKKAKKEQAQEKPVGVVYAQVDKTKKKPKKPEATYDQAERPGSKGPGDLTYAMLEHGQGSSMPRNAASQVRKPKPYVETEYAMIV